MSWREKSMRIPEGVQDLTATWLSEALTRPVTQVSVISDDAEETETVKGVVGQIARLSLSYYTVEVDAPSSLIAKLSTADPAKRAGFHGLHMYEREVRFYEKLAPQITLRTPDCYYSAIDLDTGHSVVLLEDLVGGRNVNKFGACSISETELAIGQIAQFHGSWWQSPQLNEMDWMPRLSTADFQNIQHIYQHRWEPFLERVGQNLPKPMVEIGEQLGHQLVKFLSYLEQEPRTICHNDYQPSNIFFFTEASGDLSQTVIDWQLITFGRGVSDVANFLSKSVRTDVRRKNEMTWLNMYHATLMKNGVEGYSFEECLQDYRLALFEGWWRMVFVVGGSNLTQAEEAGFCNVLLPRYCAAILDLNAGELLSEEWL
jgi:Ecdysteroid kinase-like family